MLSKMKTFTIAAYLTTKCALALDSVWHSRIRIRRRLVASEINPVASSPTGPDIDKLVAQEELTKVLQEDNVSTNATQQQIIDFQQHELNKEFSKHMEFMNKCGKNLKDDKGDIIEMQQDHTKFMKMCAEDLKEKKEFIELKQTEFIERKRDFLKQLKEDDLEPYQKHAIIKNMKQLRKDIKDLREEHKDIFDGHVKHDQETKEYLNGRREEHKETFDGHVKNNEEVMAYLKNQQEDINDLQAGHEETFIDPPDQINAGAQPSQADLDKLMAEKPITEDQAQVPDMTADLGVDELDPQSTIDEPNGFAFDATSHDEDIGDNFELIKTFKSDLLDKASVDTFNDLHKADNVVQDSHSSIHASVDTNLEKTVQEYQDAPSDPIQSFPDLDTVKTDIHEINTDYNTVATDIKTTLPEYLLQQHQDTLSDPIQSVPGLDNMDKKLQDIVDRVETDVKTLLEENMLSEPINAEAAPATQEWSTNGYEVSLLEDMKQLFLEETISKPDGSVEHPHKALETLSEKLDEMFSENGWWEDPAMKDYLPEKETFSGYLNNEKMAVQYAKENQVQEVQEPADTVTTVDTTIEGKFDFNVNNEGNMTDAQGNLIQIDDAATVGTPVDNPAMGADADMISLLDKIETKYGLLDNNFDLADFLQDHPHDFARLDQMYMINQLKNDYQDTLQATVDTPVDNAKTPVDADTADMIFGDVLAENVTDMPLTEIPYVPPPLKDISDIDIGEFTHGGDLTNIPDGILTTANENNVFEIMNTHFDTGNFDMSAMTEGLNNINEAVNAGGDAILDNIGNI